MKRIFFISAVSAFAALGVACSTTDNDASEDDAAQVDGDDDDDDDASSGGLGMSGGEVMDTGGSDGPGDSSGGPPPGEGFIETPDGGGATNECDQWVQDCPEGEKCMPWANDGGSAWNSTRCSPVSDDPGQIGDECTVDGSGVSGLDDCDVGSMCYYVDPETNIGQCVGMCFGAPEAPLCDPGFACSNPNNGVLTLCRPTCDPLLQDCTNAACLPAAGNDAFVCIVDASGEAGAAGDPCEFLNACDPGNACLDASAVEGCKAAGCCSEFCDITDADPDGFCSGAGSTCQAWFEEGEAPPTYMHVGVCALPAG